MSSYFRNRNIRCHTVNIKKNSYIIFRYLLRYSSATSIIKNVLLKSLS